MAVRYKKFLLTSGKTDPALSRVVDTVPAVAVVDDGLFVTVAHLVDGVEVV